MGSVRSKQLQRLSLMHGTRFSHHFGIVTNIADKLGVSIDYLVRGYEVGTLNSREEKLVIGFRKLSDRAQKAVLENVELLGE